VQIYIFFGMQPNKITFFASSNLLMDE